MIQWSDELSVGIPAMDDQHCTLLSFLSRLEVLMRGDSNSGELHAICKDVVVYFEQHFLEEEALMRELGFPDAEKHADEHRRMHAQVKELLESQLSGNDVCYALTRLLTTQADGHLKGWDKVFGDWIRKSGNMRANHDGCAASASSSQRRRPWWSWSMRR